MTKYVLNSAGLRKYPDKATLFFNEVLKDLGDKPKILICFFAQPREDWERKFDEYKKNFLIAIDKQITPEIELAFPDKFIEQLKNNDAIIIYGGDDYLIKYWLKQYDVPNIWQDKTVAAISAGFDVLTESFWTCDWRQCLDGLNILPIKFISHYKSLFGDGDSRGNIDWQKAYDDLLRYGDKSLPIYALEEGDFIVINK
ncbi:MAG: Type 1 glutamine amidotransferase-like domain-containing protein [Patescibacteria group bacterium]